MCVQQQDMNALMEKQLEDLQQENASITIALKESHSLCKLLGSCTTYTYYYLLCSGQTI